MIQTPVLLQCISKLFPNPLSGAGSRSQTKGLVCCWPLSIGRQGLICCSHAFPHGKHGNWEDDWYYPLLFWRLEFLVFLCAVSPALRRIWKSYTVLLWCLNSSLYPAWLPSLAKIGTWLLHIVSAQAKALRGDLKAAFHYIKGVCKKAGEEIFLQLSVWDWLTHMPSVQTSLLRQEERASSPSSHSTASVIHKNICTLRE